MLGETPVETKKVLLRGTASTPAVVVIFPPALEARSQSAPPQDSQYLQVPPPGTPSVIRARSPRNLRLDVSLALAMQRSGSPFAPVETTIPQGRGHQGASPSISPRADIGASPRELPSPSRQ